MLKKIEIEYPENLLDILQETPEKFESEAKMAMAVKLYELKKISSGFVAQIAGVDRTTFLLELHKYNVSIINIDPEDLISDIDNA